MLKLLKERQEMNLLFQKNFQRVFGTFPLTGNQLRDSIDTAIDVGYRAFDTAQMYGNERDTGLALRDSRIPRSELCIISKIHPDNYTETDFIKSLELSLSDLQVDQLDVLFLHWPPTHIAFDATLELLEKAYDLNLVKSIGISNFNSQMMDRANSKIQTKILANQVEFHPLIDQSVLLRKASETEIPLMSYSAIARGKIFEFDILHRIAADYGKTPAQIVLRWVLQKGVIANSMSTNKKNIEANYNIMDFTLSSIDMARIDTLNKNGFRVVTKDKAPWAPDWD